MAIRNNMYLLADCILLYESKATNYYKSNRATLHLLTFLKSLFYQVEIREILALFECSSPCW